MSDDKEREKKILILNGVSSAKCLIQIDKQLILKLFWFMMFTRNIHSVVLAENLFDVN